VTEEATMKYWIPLVGLMIGLQPQAWAFKGGGNDNKVLPDPNAVQHVQPQLMDIEGVVSWKTLADITTVKEKDRVVPKFSGKIAALDKQEVKLQGFMVPLEAGQKQARFLLTATSPTCGFCVPGGPDEYVEIEAKQPIKYSIEPIVVSGRFEVLSSDPGGLLYRLTKAVVTGN